MAATSFTPRVLALLALARSGSARADDPPAYETVVTATTPIHGSGLPLDHIPSNVQTGRGSAIEAGRSLDVSEHLDRAFGSVWGRRKGCRSTWRPGRDSLPRALPPT
jgi:hypothetical protein